jgi:hypothetical protein
MINSFHKILKILLYLLQVCNVRKNTLVKYNCFWIRNLQSTCEYQMIQEFEFAWSISAGTGHFYTGPF